MIRMLRHFGPVLDCQDCGGSGYVRVGRDDCPHCRRYGQACEAEHERDHARCPRGCPDVEDVVAFRRVVELAMRIAVRLGVS